jgi:NAD(P)-dependent dehydrogenase (short-subunit alcohol dehydrogenase family)
MLLDTLNPATLLSGRYKQEQIPDLSGKTAIVTGGSAGIGYHDALGLARAGAKVLILSANPEHGGTAEGEMNTWLKQHGGPKAGSVKWYQVDMADMKAVDTLAKQLKGSEDRLDILINNASKSTR